MMNLPSRMFLKKFSTVCVLLAINAGVFSALHVIIPAFAVCCTSLGLLVFYLIFFHLSYPLMKKLLLSEQINSENKAVFITGCDHGFGNSLAKRLDARGFHVFAACLFPEGPGATDLKNACSEKLKIVYLDVAKGESVEKAAYFVKQNLGTSMLWAIVNNAGIFKAFWSELSPIDSYRECFEVNSLGPVRVTNAFLPLLKKSKGRVINVTSFAGKHPLPCHAPYAMSKFAAVAFTECLSLEMNAWGIPVVEIEPEMFSMNEYISNVWWWSDPNKQWFHKIIDYIKTFLSSDNDIIIVHCENVTGFEKSIPLTNYFFNLLLTLNLLGDERAMFLNLNDMISSIELYLGRQTKKSEISEAGIPDDEIVNFYNKYINSFESENYKSEDKSVKDFKEFLKQNNCLDVRLLLDLCLEYKKNIIDYMKDKNVLILGMPSSVVLKKFINILSTKKLSTLYVETPLNISLHGSPIVQKSENIKVIHENIEIDNMIVNMESSSENGSATEEYVEDLFLSFLTILLSSRNELALSKTLISPVINFSHEAFTALKHMSVEKEMSMCQVAISYVTRIRLGGKGYAPPSDCSMIPHLKGLELFVDSLNQMQAIIEEDSNEKPAINRLINTLKKKLLKCGSDKLKESSIEAVAENLQSTHLSVSEILKSRISSNGGQICQETLDILYHFINFLKCNYFTYDPEVIIAKKHAKRTPLNLPPLLGYFRSPDEESSCDSKSSLNEDSRLSRDVIVQSTAFPSYFHNSESSSVSVSCVNSSTPSKLTFKGCVEESKRETENVSQIKVLQNTAEVKKNRKRSILSEITNEDTTLKDKTFAKSDAKKMLVYCITENAIGSSKTKKQSKKEPKRMTKKFKQVQGQGKITSFFR